MREITNEHHRLLNDTEEKRREKEGKISNEVEKWQKQKLNKVVGYENVIAH